MSPPTCWSICWEGTVLQKMKKRSGSVSRLSRIRSARTTSGMTKPKAQSLVEQSGKHRFIDRVEVRFLPSETKYWASMENFGFSRIHVPQEYYRRYERLLEGGIWAIVDVECIANEDGAKGSPFRIADLRPVHPVRSISKITQKAAHSSPPRNGWTSYCAALVWNRPRLHAG